MKYLHALLGFLASSVLGLQGQKPHMSSIKSQKEVR